MTRTIDKMPTSPRALNGLQIEVIAPSDWQPTDERRTANAKKRRRNVAYTDECFLCGTPMTSKQIEAAYHVHMTVDCDIVPIDARIPSADSQGWFPIGSECARRVPRGWKTR